jgi:hypothetical protein
MDDESLDVAPVLSPRIMSGTSNDALAGLALDEERDSYSDQISQIPPPIAEEQIIGPSSLINKEEEGKEEEKESLGEDASIPQARVKKHDKLVYDKKNHSVFQQATKKLRKSYSNYTIEAKLNAVNFAKTHSTYATARQFNVHRKTIAGWIKQEKRLILRK